MVQSEWTKLLTTRVWLWLLLGAVVLTGGFAALLTGLAGQTGGPPALSDPQYAQLVLSLASNASILTIVLGIIGTTQEYRHRTATPTFLVTPRRGRVVGAKLLAYGLVAIPMGLLIVLADVLVVEVYAGARGSAPSLSGDNLRVLAGAWAALVVYAVIGVGVGALLKNQDTARHAHGGKAVRDQQGYLS